MEEEEAFPSLLFFLESLPPHQPQTPLLFQSLTHTHRPLLTNHTHTNQQQQTTKHHKTASLHIEYPMLFRVENSAHERASHCGVLEFVAEEGRAYLPRWVGFVVPLSCSSLWGHDDQGWGPLHDLRGWDLLSTHQKQKAKPPKTNAAHAAVFFSSHALPNRKTKKQNKIHR
jgi:hypothetical protein